MGLTIGIDGDGVIFDYVEGLRQAYPDAAFSQGPFTYDMLEEGWFPSKKDWLAAHEAVMARAHDLPLNDTGSALAVARIREAGHRVVLATARNGKYEQGTVRNLELHGVVVDEVIHTGYKMSKSTLGLDVLLEDKPDTVAELVDTPTVPVTYHQPYNQHHNLDVVRVYSMEEFADWVLKL